jgi:hypothetical protein
VLSPPNKASFILFLVKFLLELSVLFWFRVVTLLSLVLVLGITRCMKKIFYTMLSVRNMVPTLTSSKRRGLSLDGRC